ncbi:hypothetical protein J6U78_03920 [bacterium]|nr:hypothetical protein [Kiritimatiellia bacterium]MBO7447458.1 hypothetical protein [bacterium]
MEEIKNEVEAPKALTEEKGGWPELWSALFKPILVSLWDFIKPAIVSFWEKNHEEVLANLKKLALDAFNDVTERIKKDKK